MFKITTLNHVGNLIIIFFKWHSFEKIAYVKLKLHISIYHLNKSLKKEFFGFQTKKIKHLKHQFGYDTIYNEIVLMKKKKIIC